MSDAPFRRQFDAARDPYAARNALGITGTGGSGGGAPTDAEYIVAVDDPTLTNDRVLTNTATVTWDLATAGQVKANAIVPASTYQPLDADLTAIAALTGTNDIYYRSAANTWSPVVVSTGLAFSGGNLTATGGTAATGSVINSAYAELTTHTTTTAAMAGGADTIPQQTDGVQLLTVSITPTASTSKLRVHVSLPATISTAVSFWAALFRDSTAAAIAAVMQTTSADGVNSLVMNVEVTAGSTSATTFKIRFGNFNGVASTLAVNGISSARRLGGAQRVAITVLELKA